MENVLPSAPERNPLSFDAVCDLVRTVSALAHPLDSENEKLWADPISGEALDGLIAIRNATESLDYEDGDDEGRMAAQEKALDFIRETAYRLLHSA